jgi:hypothetical protein
MDGICTLANDRVYDQLIALLNSIEAIYGQQIPVCIYPYDDNITQIQTEISRRPHVQLYDNQKSIQAWDNFARQIWDAHPTAKKSWQKISREQYYRFGTHRRYCAFDGPFDRFVYMDADTLLMSPLESIFTLLECNDWVVYDFQFKDLSHVYNISSPKLTKIFPLSRLQTEIFCSGFYATKKNIFTVQQREWLLENLRQGEVEILYEMAPDQTILNYMVMRAEICSYNCALYFPENVVTGCCVTSTHFQARDSILYDNNKRLTYIHYIGLSSQLFSQVCNGKNIDFPYREIFLHYRYLHEPNKRPQFPNKSKAYKTLENWATRILKKLGVMVEV